MSELVLQELTEQGAALNKVAVDDTNGDTVQNSNGDSFIMLDNSGASAAACVVTIKSQRPTFNDSAYGTSKKDSVVINLAADDVNLCGRYAKIPFNNSTGKLEISYSGDVTGLTIASFRGNL